MRNTILSNLDSGFFLICGRRYDVLVCKQDNETLFTHMDGCQDVSVLSHTTGEMDNLEYFESLLGKKFHEVNSSDITPNMGPAWWPQ